jgi:hypothetical protein
LFLATYGYRVPKLLVGTKNSTAIDMWYLDWIMAELLAKEPLFNGKNELEQLDNILDAERHHACGEFAHGGILRSVIFF